MLPQEFEGFVTYAIGISLLVALIALWRVRKRGRSGLFMVGAALAFALFLYLVLRHAGDNPLYAAGVVVVGCLVADFMVRKKPEKP
jgi:hypothetical protein